MDYKDEYVKLSDLVDDRGTLRGHTFETCEIHGPAVLWFENPESLDRTVHTFDAPWDECLWPFPSHPQSPGAIRVAADCRFSGACQFHNVGVVAGPRTIQAAQASRN